MSVAIPLLGCGVDVCYPAENAELKGEREAKGLIVSEYPPGRKPERYHFPQRNRIISGLSELTLVIQAGNASGALITAELAAGQGREVCAVPGNVDNVYCVGSNKLIQEGACAVLNPGDVLELLGVEVVFAYPGGQAIELHQALIDSDLRVVLPRQVRAAALAAPFPRRWK